MSDGLGGKQYGKTTSLEDALRRRSATRKSGYQSHPDFSGGEFVIANPQGVEVSAGSRVTFRFDVPRVEAGEFVGFGGWFCAPSDAVAAITPQESAPKRKATLQPGDAPSWSKAGSMWRGPSEAASYELTVDAPADRSCVVWYYGMGAGRIEHEHLSTARENLLGNMHKFSPEAHFYVTAEVESGGAGGTVSIGTEVVLTITDSTLTSRSPIVRSDGTAPPLYLKACNRCGRFLPINYPDERHHLSFSNHCVAPHRRPCKHSNFGLLKNVKPQAGGPDELDLEYGYQLECRFCKKFEVNAAHNPKRTAAQMKEDGARRRNFEVLLRELYGASDSLRYRERTGRELVDDVYRAFGEECFNCGTALPTPKSMHLDHTRPLALLWPLETGRPPRSAPRATRPSGTGRPSSSTPRINWSRWRRSPASHSRSCSTPLPTRRPSACSRVGWTGSSTCFSSVRTSQRSATGRPPPTSSLRRSTERSGPGTGRPSSTSWRRRGGEATESKTESLKLHS